MCRCWGLCCFCTPLLPHPPFLALQSVSLSPIVYLPVPYLLPETPLSPLRPRVARTRIRSGWSLPPGASKAASAFSGSGIGGFGYGSHGGGAEVCRCLCIRQYMLAVESCRRHSAEEERSEDSSQRRCMRGLVEVEEEEEGILLCSEECSRRGVRWDCGLLVTRSRGRWGKCGWFWAEPFLFCTLPGDIWKVESLGLFGIFNLSGYFGVRGWKFCRAKK